MLKGKKILIGVTAGIAAYKITYLIRQFIKAGARVKVIMTPASIAFITPLTLSTLSKNPVESEFTDNKSTWNNHVELGLWADVFVIAPLSANTLAKMAHGLCDNFLLATYLSARCPVYFAPAMDVDMIKHPATKSNIEKLVIFGNHLIEPETGELASGLFGEGRMAEPEQIFKVIEKHFNQNLPLKSVNVLITAGPTFESIDPIRFIGNRSSGKMGYALAEELASQGAIVTLVSGPTALTAKNPNIKTILVESAEEMYGECTKRFPESDITIMAAAVADYKPAKPHSKKIKKKSADFTIELKPTTDILKELGKLKKPEQKLIGFALETDNEFEYAKAKIQSKNLDMIVLNSLKDKGAGFQVDTNKINIIYKDNKIKSFELKSKAEVAKDIVDYIITKLPAEEIIA